MGNEKIEPVYEDGKLGIKVVPNPRDDGGYDVFVRKTHFYIPSRVLPDISRKEYSTENVMRSLNAMNNTIPYILSDNEISRELAYCIIKS